MKKKHKRLLLSKMKLEAEKLKEMVQVAFGTIRTGSTEPLESSKVAPLHVFKKREQKCQPKP